MDQGEGEGPMDRGDRGRGTRLGQGWMRGARLGGRGEDPWRGPRLGGQGKDPWTRMEGAKVREGDEVKSHGGMVRWMSLWAVVREGREERSPVDQATLDAMLILSRSPRKGTMSPKAFVSNGGTRQVFGFDAPFATVDPTASLRTIQTTPSNGGGVQQQQTTPTSQETAAVSIPQDVYQSKGKRKSSPPINTPHSNNSTHSNNSKRH